VRVDVNLKNGTTLEQTVEAPRGSEKSFASKTDVIQKFKKLATHVISNARADNVVNLVLGADKLDNAARISQALVTG